MRTLDFKEFATEFVSQGGAVQLATEPAQSIA